MNVVQAIVYLVRGDVRVGVRPGSGIGRQGELGRGRRDGRRAGQRQARRLHDHAHRGERRGRAATAFRRRSSSRVNMRYGFARRLRPRCPPFPSTSRRPGCNRRSQAAQDQGARRAALERRMDRERAGHRPAEGAAPQLRRLPLARARRCARRTTPTLSCRCCRACKAT